MTPGALFSTPHKKQSRHDADPADGTIHSRIRGGPEDRLALAATFDRKLLFDLTVVAKDVVRDHAVLRTVLSIPCCKRGRPKKNALLLDWPLQTTARLYKARLPGVTIVRRGDPHEGKIKIELCIPEAARLKAAELHEAFNLPTSQIIAFALDDLRRALARTARHRRRQASSLSSWPASRCDRSAALDLD